MGTQLVIKEVVLNDVSKDGLAYKLEGLDMTICSCREKLMMLAASTPRPIPDCEGNPIDWVDHVQAEINRTLQEIEDAFVRKHLVMVALGDLNAVEESY